MRPLTRPVTHGLTHGLTRAVTGVVALVVVMLAACATVGPPAARPTLTFANQPPLNLDVAQIRLAKRYVPPLAPPHVEHLMPVAPGAGVERWVLDVPRAVGRSGVAEVIIKEASVREVDLKTTGGLRGLLTNDQAQRYDARLVVDLRIDDPAGGRLGEVRVVVTRSQSAAEDISPNQREALWFRLAEALLRDFALSMDRQVKTDLPQFTR